MWAAVGVLQPEFEDKATFTLRNLQDEGVLEESEQYEFGPAKHGLVGISPDGRAVVLLGGHDYGEAEIRDQLMEFLR